MVTKPKLSVVVPVTLMAGRLENLRHWIPMALEREIEVIVLHDFRDEMTSAELKEFIGSLNNANVSLIEKEFGDQGSARNFGLELSKSKWVAFWDSDDLPNLENVQSGLNSIGDDVDILIGQFSLKQLNQIPIKTKWNKTVLSLHANLGLWRMIFRKNFLVGVSFPPTRMAEDQIFFVRVLNKTPKIAFDKREYYQYFVGNPGQVTRDRDALRTLPWAIKEIKISSRDIKRKSMVLLAFIMRLRLTLTYLKFRAGEKRND